MILKDIIMNTESHCAGWKSRGTADRKLGATALRRLLCALLLALSWMGLNARAEVQRVVVRPADTGEALVNPGMGWTLHFYSNMIRNYGSKLEPRDTLDDWPGLSVVYL